MDITIAVNIDKKHKCQYAHSIFIKQTIKQISLTTFIKNSIYNKKHTIFHPKTLNDLHKNTKGFGQKHLMNLDKYVRI